MNQNALHQEIISLLGKEKSSYAAPVNSEYLGQKLRISPSYVRTQMCSLIKAKLVAVRRGNGGGYYLIGGENMETDNATLVDQREVMIDSIEYMIQYTDRLATGLREIAVLLQTGAESSAFGKLPDAVDGMSLMLQLIQSCIVIVKLETKQMEPYLETIHLLGDQIGEMNAAIERRDYGTLADQCEYELAEMIEEQVKPTLVSFYQLIQNKHTA